MTGQSAEAKRVADDGAWRVLYGAVCRDRHVDAAHRHVLCTPDVIFTSWSSWRPPSETRNGPHRPGSIPGRVASNCSGRSRSRCRCRDHDRDVDGDCVLCHAHVPDSGAMTRAQADGAIRDAAPNAMTDVASGDASGAAPSSAALDATPTDGHVMSSLIEGWGNARAARSSSCDSIEGTLFSESPTREAKGTPLTIFGVGRGDRLLVILRLVGYRSWGL